MNVPKRSLLSLALLILSCLGMQTDTTVSTADGQLSLRCEKGCTRAELADMKIAVQGLQDTEAGQCFADYLSGVRDINTSNDPSPSTASKIVSDVRRPMQAEIEIFTPSFIFGQIKDASECANEDPNKEDLISLKQHCFDWSDYKGEAMTIGHEITHKLGYKHNGQVEHANNNEKTVPYLTQYAICRCWKGMAGPARKRLLKDSCGPEPSAPERATLPPN